MQFEVRALRGQGIETLRFEAASEDEVRRLASSQDLQVLSMGRARSPWPHWTGSKLQLGLFSQELFELLDAGLSVVEAIDALACRGTGVDDGGAVYHELFMRLQQGHSFSAALESMPERFPPLYVGMVQAAERTSDLKGALGRYLEYSTRLDALRSKIISALVYPAILAGVGSAVILFLLGFVVPRFAAVYQGSGRALPWMSALLLEWGAFADRHGVTLALGTLAVVSVSGWWLFSAWRDGRLEGTLDLLPAVRRKTELFRLSRLYLTVGTLLNGGTPIVQALLLARGVVHGRSVTSIDMAIDELRKGESITRTLERHGLSTPVALRLLRAGEGTGRLGDLFMRVARYHDNELGRWIERFSRSFEPLLMAAIGVVIGVVVVLLYLPIFDLAGSFR